MRVDFQAFNPTLSAQVFRLFQNPAGDPPAFEFVIDRDPMDHSVGSVGQPLPADHRRVFSSGVKAIVAQAATMPSSSTR